MRSYEESEFRLPCLSSHHARPVVSSFLKNKFSRRFVSNAWSGVVGPYRGSPSPVVSGEDEGWVPLLRSSPPKDPNKGESFLPLIPLTGESSLEQIVFKGEGSPASSSHYDRLLQELMKKETARRELLIFEECHFYTKHIVKYLQTISELMSLTRDGEATVHEIQSRERDRKMMLDTIGKETTHRLARARAEKALRHQFSALLPAFLKGRREILAAEQEALQEVFAVEKARRPIGPGCFLPHTTKTDPRLRGPRPPCKSRRSRHSTLTERSLTLRKGTQCSDNTSSHTQGSNAGALVLFSSKDFGKEIEEERIFEWEGLQMYRQEKLRQYAALKRSSAFVDLHQDEIRRRRDIRVAESEAWIPLMRRCVDGLYDAKHQTRRREAHEASEAFKSHEEGALREEIKEHWTLLHSDQLLQRLRNFSPTRGRALDGDEMFEEVSEETLRSEAATAEVVRIWQNFSSDMEKRGSLITERQESESVRIGSSERARTPSLGLVVGEAGMEEVRKRISLSISHRKASIPVSTVVANDWTIIEWQSPTTELGSFSTSHLMKVHWKQDLLFISLISQFNEHITQVEADYKERIADFIKDMLRQRINIVEEQIEHVWCFYCQFLLEKKAKR
ncbi:unnamed protein product [Phytomonas sp. Hart1]|nr:unnamed protein product [Phytomonas sp. Hart1]|eukprot:CCW70662.1 unnamed protein product [Phytomonas sp. isolate Hart1]